MILLREFSFHNSTIESVKLVLFTSLRSREARQEWVWAGYVSEIYFDSGLPRSSRVAIDYISRPAYLSTPFEFFAWLDPFRMVTVSIQAG